MLGKQMGNMNQAEIKTVKHQIRKSIRRFLLYAIGIYLVIYLFTEPLIYGIHYVLFQPNDYISYSTPTIRYVKYFIIGMVLSFLAFRYMQLTKAGKRFFTVTLIASILGFFTTSLWFNAVSENEIVRFRVILSESISWDDVEYVSTHVYRSDGRTSYSGAYSKPRKVIKEYNLHFADGTSLNVWSDLDSMVKLHNFTLKQGLYVEHLSDAEYFDFRYKNYFNKDLEDAYFVFGIQGPTK